MTILVGPCLTRKPELERDILAFLENLKGGPLELEIHAGNYVGIGKNKILVNGPTISKVIEELNDAGIKHALVVKIPKAWKESDGKRK